MRLFKTKTLIVSAVAMLAITGVAYAGTATMQRDKAKDGSCLTTVAAAQTRTNAQAGDKAQTGTGAQAGTNARDRQKLHDGTCLTTVAAAPDRLKAQDRQNLHDGSCLTTVA